MEKNNNPYPKTIHDEDADVEVLNDKWVAWEEGREEGYRGGMKKKRGDAVILFWGLVFLLFIIGCLYYFGGTTKESDIVSQPTSSVIYRDFYVTQVVLVEVVREVPSRLETSNFTFESIKGYYDNEGRLVITREVSTPIEYREWQSLDQVAEMFKGSVTTFQSGICLNTAQALQELALEQGYPVSIALAQYGNYYGQHVTEASGGHAGLLVEVKGSWYFIDPLPWRVTKLFTVEGR